MAKIKDKFDQFMVFSVTMTSANTLTFSEINLGLNLFQYAGLIVTRIEYSPSIGSIGELSVNADNLSMGITGDNSITDIDLARPEVYDRIEIRVAVSGTPGNMQLIEVPIVHDFSNMEGGGLLVPAQDIYLAMNTSGFASAGIGGVRLYYRMINLAASDFIELVQRLRVLST